MYCALLNPLSFSFVLLFIITFWSRYNRMGTEVCPLAGYKVNRTLISTRTIQI